MFLKNIRVLFFIFIFNSAFAVESYNIFSKEIGDEFYNFAIPNTFCEHNSQDTNNKNIQVFQFVKCYEIELEQEGELAYFSEKILIGTEKEDKRVQNITDKFFARSQKDLYNKMTYEEKSNYLFNENYNLNNEQRSFIKNNKFISYRKGFNDIENKFISYESNLFLNKRFFMINWSQYLTKNETLMNNKKFIDFIEENTKNNNNNEDIILSYKNNSSIRITIPRFNNFANFTNKVNINDGNFDAVFANLINEKDNFNPKIFKVSILQQNMNTKDIYDRISDNKNIDLINYKNNDFIKISRENTFIYSTYVNIRNDLSLLVSLETNDNNGIKDILNYKNQLIKDNKNGR